MEDTKKNSLQKLRAKLAPMNWVQRIEYIWSYHKETIIISSVMLIIAIYLIAGLITNGKQMQLGGLLANVNLSDEGKAYLTKGYMEYLEGDPTKETVNLTTVELDDFQNTATMELTYYSLTKTLAMLTDAEVDYLLMDKTALELYMAHNTFLDLREVLPATILDSMEEQIIRLKTVDENGDPVDAEYPIAIDISQFPFIQQCTDGQSPVYFGVALNSPNVKKMVMLWEYLNAWEAVS